MQLLLLLQDFSHHCACVIYVKYKTFSTALPNQDNHQTSRYYLIGLLHWVWNSAHSSVTAPAEEEKGLTCHQKSGLQDVSLLIKSKQWHLKSVGFKVLSSFQDFSFSREVKPVGSGRCICAPCTPSNYGASLSLSPKKVIERQPNGQLPAGLGMPLHIVLSTILQKWMCFLVWCLLSFVFSGRKGRNLRGGRKMDGHGKSWAQGPCSCSSTYL